MTRNTRNLLLASGFILVLLIAGIYLVSGHINAGSNDSKIETAQAKEPSDSTFTPVNAEVLFIRQTSDYSAWDICVLHLPSGKVTVLTGTGTATMLGSDISNEAVFSPDGQQVLFAASAKDRKIPAHVTQHFADNGELLDLWIFDRKSNRLKRLTTDSQGYSSLKWSPDGRYISARGMRSWTTPEIPPTETGVLRQDLYIHNVQTNHRWLVTTNVTDEDWQPNGSSLLFVDGDYSTGWNNGWRVGLWNRSTAIKRYIASNTGEDATWLPNGKGLLFTRESGDMGIYLSLMADKSQNLVTNTISRVFFNQWSPQGSKVICWIPGSDDLMLLDWHEKSWDVLLSKAYYATFRWSADSKSVAVAYNTTIPDNQPVTTRFLVLEMPSRKTKVSRMFDGNVDVLRWTPEGKTVIVLHTQYNRIAEVAQIPQRIVGISTDTGDIHEITRLSGTSSYTQTHFMDWRFIDK